MTDAQPAARPMPPARWPACGSCPMRGAGPCPAHCDRKGAHDEADHLMILAPGEAPPAASRWLLVEGIFRLDAPQTRRGLVDLVLPGALVTRGGLRAVTPVVLCRLEPDARPEPPDATLALLHQLGRARMLAWLRGHLDVPHRVAAFLALASIFAPRIQRRDGSLVLRIEIGRRDVADLLDLSRETVSRGLGRLRDLGLAEPLSDQRLRLPDLGALLAYGGMNPATLSQDFGGAPPLSTPIPTL